MLHPSPQLRVLNRALPGATVPRVFQKPGSDREGRRSQGPLAWHRSSSAT
jgi:hypothetical protein